MFRLRRNSGFNALSVIEVIIVMVSPISHKRLLIKRHIAKGFGFLKNLLSHALTNLWRKILPLRNSTT